MTTGQVTRLVSDQSRVIPINKTSTEAFMRTTNQGTPELINELAYKCLLPVHFCLTLGWLSADFLLDLEMVLMLCLAILHCSELVQIPHTRWFYASWLHLGSWDGFHFELMWTGVVLCMVRCIFPLCCLLNSNCFVDPVFQNFERWLILMSLMMTWKVKFYPG